MNYLFLRIVNLVNLCVIYIINIYKMPSQTNITPEEYNDLANKIANLNSMIDLSNINEKFSEAAVVRDNIINDISNIKFITSNITQLKSQSSQ